MRPNSQAFKHKSSHDTEREFGGTLGESEQPDLPSITLLPLPFYLNPLTMNSTLYSNKCDCMCCS